MVKGKVGSVGWIGVDVQLCTLCPISFIELRAHSLHADILVLKNLTL